MKLIQFIFIFNESKENNDNDRFDGLVSFRGGEDKTRRTL